MGLIFSALLMLFLYETSFVARGFFSFSKIDYFVLIKPSLNI